MARTHVPEVAVQPEKISKPIQFFSLISSLAAISIVGAGIFALSIDKAAAWFLIGVGSLLLIGISTSLIYIWWERPERFVEPKDLTREFVESLRALRSRGAIDPETTKRMDALVSEGILLAYDHAFNFGRDLLKELSNLISASDIAKDRRSELNLSGKWRGEVNNQEQLIVIVHNTSEILLEGYVSDSRGEALYSFRGQGWLCLSILIFVWQIDADDSVDTKGINIMNVIDDGNTIEGKYFNEAGATGYECYRRKQEL